MDCNEQKVGCASDRDFNPACMKPKKFAYWLQKIRDEYAAGVLSQFTTNNSLLERGLELLQMLKQDSGKLASANLHELLRAWENTHRMRIAESHLRHVLLREESPLTSDLFLERDRGKDLRHFAHLFLAQSKVTC